MPFVKTATEENDKNRFWSKVVKQQDGCWIFTGNNLHPWGYAFFRTGCPRRNILAHRYSLLISGVEIKGKHVCHLCDVPRCVNPDHLVAADNNFNRADSVSKRRHAYGITQGHAKLDPEKVIQMRRMSNEGMSAREIGYIFGVQAMTAFRAIKRRTWKSVD